jgi:hypothetical protein
MVGCSTGYKSQINKENDAKVFKPPKEERQFILYDDSLWKEVTESVLEKIMCVLDILKKNSSSIPVIFMKLF